MEHEITEHQIEKLIGMTIEEANRYLPSPYYTIPSTIDGVNILHDCAFRPNRLHVTVVNEKITEVGNFG